MRFTDRERKRDRHKRMYAHHEEDRLDNDSSIALCTHDRARLRCVREATFSHPGLRNSPPHSLRLKMISAPRLQMYIKPKKRAKTLRDTTRDGKNTYACTYICEGTIKTATPIRGRYTRKIAQCERTHTLKACTTAKMADELPKETCLFTATRRK